MCFIVDIQFSTSLVLLFAIIHKCIFIFWCMLQTYRSSMCSHFYRNLFIHFNVSFQVYISWSSSYMIFRSTLFWDAYVVVFVLKKDKHTVLSFENMWKATFSKVLWKKPTSFYYLMIWHVSTEMNKNENFNDTLFLTANNRWTTSSSINIKQHHINLSEIRRDRKFLTDVSSEETYVKNFQS